MSLLDATRCKSADPICMFLHVRQVPGTAGSSRTPPFSLMQGLPSLVTAAQAPGQAYPASSNALQLYGLPVCWLTKITDSEHLQKLPASPCVLTSLALCWGALAGKHSGDDHRVHGVLFSSELANRISPIWTCADYAAHCLWFLSALLLQMWQPASKSP